MLYHSLHSAIWWFYKHTILLALASICKAWHTREQYRTVTPDLALSVFGNHLFTRIRPESGPGLTMHCRIWGKGLS